MEVLFDGEIFVDHAQVYVESDDQYTASHDDSWRGQANGICGAAFPGLMLLQTGTDTGRVPFNVELHDAQPPLEESWEDVVEVSFRPTSERVLMVGGLGQVLFTLTLRIIDYRVRYCAVGMDAAQEQDMEDDEKALDRYLLQFWPAPPAGDAVIREGSEHATMWHGNTY